VAQHDTAEGAATASLETAWATTRPTVTGGYFGDGIVPTVIGNGFLFDFIGREIVVALKRRPVRAYGERRGRDRGTIGGWVEWME
jgi:hypothetical protein